MQAQHRAANLQTGAMNQGAGFRIRFTVHHDVIYPDLASAPGPDQQPHAIFPAEIQVTGPDSIRRNHKVTGAERPEDAVPDYREPGLGRQFTAAGNNHELPNGTAGRICAPGFLLFPHFTDQPSQGSNQEQDSDESKKEAGNLPDGLIHFRRHAEQQVHTSFQGGDSIGGCLHTG